MAVIQPNDIKHVVEKNSSNTPYLLRMQIKLPGFLISELFRVHTCKSIGFSGIRKINYMPVMRIVLVEEDLYAQIAVFP